MRHPGPGVPPSPPCLVLRAGSAFCHLSAKGQVLSSHPATGPVPGPVLPPRLLLAHDLIPPTLSSWSSKSQSSISKMFTKASHGAGPPPRPGLNEFPWQTPPSLPGLILTAHGKSAIGYFYADLTKVRLPPETSRSVRAGARGGIVSWHAVWIRTGSAP